MRQSKGQNIAEMVLASGLIIALFLTSVDLGRAWMSYHGAKSAAIDGAVTAAQANNAADGQAQIQQRLAQANLTMVRGNVQAIEDGLGFESDVAVRFQPLFGGITLPVGSTTITVVPSEFILEYQSTRYYTTY